MNHLHTKTNMSLRWFSGLILTLLQIWLLPFCGNRVISLGCSVQTLQAQQANKQQQIKRGFPNFNSLKLLLLMFVKDHTSTCFTVLILESLMLVFTDDWLDIIRQELLV